MKEEERKNLFVSTPPKKEKGNRMMMITSINLLINFDLIASTYFDSISNRAFFWL